MKRTIFIYSLPRQGSSGFARCFEKNHINFAEYLRPGYISELVYIPKKGYVKQVLHEASQKQVEESKDFSLKWSAIKKYRSKGVFKIFVDQYNEFYKHQKVYKNATNDAHRNIFLFRRNGLDAWTSFCLAESGGNLLEQHRHINVTQNQIDRYTKHGYLKHLNKFLENPPDNLHNVVILESIKTQNIIELNAEFPGFKPKLTDLQKDFCTHTILEKKFYIQNYDELVDIYNTQVKKKYEEVKTKVRLFMKNYKSFGEL